MVDLAGRHRAVGIGTRDEAGHNYLCRLLRLLFDFPALRKKDGKSVRWVWSLSSDECFKIAGYLILILIGGWFVEEVAGWPLTIASMLCLREGIAAFDVELARGEDRNLIDVDHFLWNPKRGNTLFGQLYAKFMEVDVGI